VPLPNLMCTLSCPTSSTLPTSSTPLSCVLFPTKVSSSFVLQLQMADHTIPHPVTFFVKQLIGVTHEINEVRSRSPTRDSGALN
jgi:hypothetical protein